MTDVKERSEQNKPFQSTSGLIQSVEGENPPPCKITTSTNEPLKWVSVDERLPEKDGLFCIFYEALDDESGYQVVFFDSLNSSFGFHSGMKITHWLDLEIPALTKKPEKNQEEKDKEAFDVYIENCFQNMDAELYQKIKTIWKAVLYYERGKG